MIRAALITRARWDETAFYLRNILGRGAQIKGPGGGAGAQPSGGSPEPSPGDVSATKLALRALPRLGIIVLDHAIVAGDRAFSMRAAGAIDEADFLAQAPGDTLLSGWLG